MPKFLRLRVTQWNAIWEFVALSRHGHSKTEGADETNDWKLRVELGHFNTWWGCFYQITDGITASRRRAKSFSFTRRVMRNPPHLVSECERREESAEFMTLLPYRCCQFPTNSPLMKRSEREEHENKMGEWKTPNKDKASTNFSQPCPVPLFQRTGPIEVGNIAGGGHPSKASSACCSAVSSEKLFWQRWMFTMCFWVSSTFFT